MLVYKGPGDIFTLDTELKVCPVNVVGVMGNGLALAFKKRYPYVYAEYRVRCLQGQLKIGGLFVKDGVVCFPTKKEWWRPSRVEYLQASFEQLVEYCNEHKVKTLAIPAVGCGYGKGDIKEVELMVDYYLGQSFATKVWFLTKK